MAVERRQCPEGRCDGSSWILGEDDIARPCSCQAGRAQRRQHRGVASQIPTRYQGASFDRPPISNMAREPATRAAIQHVREFVEDVDARLDGGRGLWFFGDVGTGKTLLGMLVARRAIEAGHTVAIYSLPELLARIRRTFDADGGDSYTAFFDRLATVDLLYLDDLGAEKRTDWVLEQLYALVNRRYEDARAVMVTTNLDHVALEQQIGQRTVSRLTELCDQIPMSGPDRRYGHIGPGEVVS